MAAKKQQSKVAPVGAKRPGVAPRPIMGGAQYANPFPVHYNAGMPAGARRPQAKPAQPKKKEKPVPVKKNRRREREYFFIMRRGVCLVIMLLALVWVGVFALNYLGILPEYTSFLIQPDLTPLDERIDVETGELDEDGNAIVEEYVDKSAYVSFIDPIFGALKEVLGVDMGTDEDGNSLSAFYEGTLEQLAPESASEEETEGEGTEGDDIVAEAAGEEEEEEVTEDEVTEGEESEEGAEEEEEVVTFPPQVSTAVISDEAREADGMTQIAALAWTYFPIVLVAGAVFALIIIIIAALSLTGRRIYKGFGLMSIIMLLGGIFALIAGLAAMGNYMGNPMLLEDGTATSVLDFSQIVAFMTGALNGAPATAIDPETTAQPLTMVAGYGLLIILIIPIVILILSFFARKKVPYSIFDK